MAEIRIRNWTRWQSYRSDRGQPPWIKVHRRLLRDPNFVSLTDAQRGQLLVLWILAADNDGVIPASATMARKLGYMDDEPDLQVFIDAGFIESDATATPARRQPDRPEAEAEEETDTETTGSASPTADVENSTEGGDGHGGEVFSSHVGSGEARSSLARREGRDSPEGGTVPGSLPVSPDIDSPVYTEWELATKAEELLGLGSLGDKEKATNRRILKTWLYGRPHRESFEVMLAIEGAAMMRDQDLIGWPSARPGCPMTLKALNGPMTLADQGDGHAVRDLYTVAVEFSRARDAPQRTARTRLKGESLKAIGSMQEIQRLRVET